MNKLTTMKRAQILGMMVEGMSIRAICRLTGASKNTVAKLLVDAGQACLAYQDRVMVNLSCRRIQCDEIWSFVGMKEKTAKREGVYRAPGVGDFWTWTAGRRYGKTAALGALQKAFALRRLGYRPHLPALIGGRIVEVISYPFPVTYALEERFAVMVRMVPGDPTTMTQVEIPPKALDFLA